MGLLARLFGKKEFEAPPPPPPAARQFITPLEAVPGAREALRAFKTGDRQLAEQLYRGSRDSGFRYAFVRQLADDAPCATGFATPFDDDVTRDVLWRTVRGVYHIRIGWDARGGGTANTVTDDAAKILFMRCEMAVNDLDEAATVAPDDDVPFVCMMGAARGLSETDLGESAYLQATQRNPNSWGAGFQRIEWLSPRWFGSIEQVSEFARRESARVQTGELAALPILAHNDINFYHVAFEEDREAAARARVAAAPEIRDCLARSVDAPGAARMYSTSIIRHYGGALLWQVADEDGARAQLSKVGDVYEGWCWLQNKRAYENVRARLALD